MSFYDRCCRIPRQFSDRGACLSHGHVPAKFYDQLRRQDRRNASCRRLLGRLSVVNSNARDERMPHGQRSLATLLRDIDGEGARFRFISSVA